jgi:FlaA1/EpsC-like NDP-sugar epimerase
MALRELERNVKYKYTMVGFIDDDPQKLGKMIHGVRVIGTIKDIPVLAKPYRIDEAFLAISRINSDAIRSILKQCDEAGIKCRIVPAIVDSLNGKIYLNKIRDIEISDIFGRQPVELDFSGIGKFITDSKILITGAGGSIGSELSRQIAEYKPNTLILVDRNENYLHEIQCELENYHKSLPMHFILADIKEEIKMEKIFTSFQPEIVFHAAAQKHVPLSEANIDEAVKNNIHGTKILAKLSNKYRATHFVMISTDKAVNPTSVMGVTKRIAEKYIQSLSKNCYTKFVIVRFGNVMNSNGSVVPMFVKQIERGGPVTVTHPDIERFFMSIPEAVQLILQAVIIGRNGEILILNMGNPVKILDLASELIKRSGFTPNRDIKIEFTGLRPGEKLFEELVGKEEEVLITSHSQLKVIRSNNIIELNEFEQKISQLLNFVQDNDPSKFKEKFQEIVPEYNHPENNALINEKYKNLTRYITISKETEQSIYNAGNSDEEEIINLKKDSGKNKIPALSRASRVLTI